MKSLRPAQWCLRLGIYGLITAVIINGLLAFTTILSMAGDWEKVIGDGFLNLANCATRKLGFEKTPRKMNGWNLKSHPSLKSGKSSEPNHHDFSFQPFIFQGVQIGLPKKERKGIVSKVPTLNFCGDLCGKVSRSDVLQLGSHFGETRCRAVIFYGRAVIFH